MGYHDKTDRLEQLVNDGHDANHTPWSVQQSARKELARRGYTQREIDDVRLYGEAPEERT